MYIPIIILILIALYHVMKIRYSAFCAAVYKIYCDRRSNPDLFPENKVSDCMLEVLSEDSDYKETIRILRINNFLNIRPFVYVFGAGDNEIVKEIKPRTDEAIRKFKEEFKDTL